MYDIANLGQAAWGLTSADFNNDDNMDFAVSSATVPFTRSTISIFYNDEDLGFTQDDVFTFSYSYISDLESGDFDNDEDIDLLFTYSEYVWDQGLPVKINGVVNLLFNDGENNFGNRTEVAWHGPGTPYDPENRINPQITSADYDMDGDIDFLVGDNSGKVELYLNNGLGNFTSAGIIYDYFQASWGLTSADFDGDGDVDFLVAAPEGIKNPPGNTDIYGHIYLKENQILPTHLSTCFKSGPGDIIANFFGIPATASLTPFDYDNDGDLDFIAGINDRIYLYIYDQGLYFPCKCWVLPPNQGYKDDLTKGALTSADYNNDGKDEFIAGGVQAVIRLFTINYTQPTSAVLDKPKAGRLYIFDKETKLHLPIKTIILGKITIEAKTIGDIQNLEFLIESNWKYTATEPPYKWLWRGFSFGTYCVTIIGYDVHGWVCANNLFVWKFF